MHKSRQSLCVGRALIRREYERPGFAKATTEPVTDVRRDADVLDPLRSLTADGGDQQVTTERG